MSDLPVRPRRARYDGGVREEDRVEEEEEEEEEEDTVYVNADSVRDQGSGSQGATGAQGVQRELVIQKHIVTACAVCLLLLCVLGALRTTHKAMDYCSEFEQQQANYTNLILERDQLETNLILERNQLQSEVNQLKRDRSEFEQLQANYTNLILERDQLQSEVNQLKRVAEGWKWFGDRWYRLSTEKKSWEDSRQDCLKMGADLVVINNTEEQEFIRGFSQDDGDFGSWIGLKKTGDKWTWVNGIPATAQYWLSGRPGNHGNCAGYYRTTGGCYDWTCTTTQRWICEK